MPFHLPILHATDEPDLRRKFDYSPTEEASRPNRERRSDMRGRLRAQQPRRQRLAQPRPSLRIPETQPARTPRTCSPADRGSRPPCSGGTRHSQRSPLARKVGRSGENARSRPPARTAARLGPPSGAAPGDALFGPRVGRLRAGLYRRRASPTGHLAAFTVKVTLPVEQKSSATYPPEFQSVKKPVIVLPLSCPSI